jgi:hypothetical protein
MNFIIGFLLLISGAKDKECFWTFVNLCIQPKFMIIGLYDEDFPLVKFLNSVNEQLLNEYLPEL